ncbi:50S ribosomal protein L19e [Candidatus Woesearchaeota archaeon]|nr:50S ribosomal protein L19e [Candidatus Woesearchaeota archaeon]MBW3006056.1 50S ribosomal protein L19e [Candidatus Woesearchaeota archaeon]
MKKLKLQKRLAAEMLKCSPNRVHFVPERLSDIKEAITKADIRGLIKQGVIKERPVIGISRVRARKIKLQKRKGRQKGSGSRKGKFSARAKPKDVWMNAVRAQRKFLKELKDKDLLTPGSFWDLYRKSKGGFFRSVRHIKLFIKEKGMVKEK